MTYITNFSSIDDVIEQYEAPKDALDGAIIHLAWYGYGSYDGQSLVVFEKDGVLWEVNGDHCSCFGLGGQWKPEETSWSALGMRIIADNYTGGSNEAQETLTALVRKHSEKS